MKKLITLIVGIIALFVIFMFVFLSPKTYEKEYKINDYEINETYNKDKKYYSFEIEKEDYKFDYVTDMKYTTKRQLITEIEEYSVDDYHCIKPIIKNLETYEMCYQGNELVSKNVLEELKESEVEKSYNKINIYDYQDKTYLIWNYKGFYFINKDEQKEIKLLDNDQYDMSLVAIVNNYLIVPNYSQEYKFDEVFIINLKNGKSETWKLDYEINYDSYVMGSFDKSIYIFDNKEKKQYELVPHKKKMRIRSENGISKIYTEEWQDISTDKLHSSKDIFKYFSLIEYYVKSGNLYMKNRQSDLETRISNLKDVEIVTTKENTVYYLKEDKLYSYSPYQGEVLLMNHFEWNFNSTNMIYIY